MRTLWLSPVLLVWEETLEIEYIESVLPPQKLSEFPHDDWVSSISCQIPGLFLTTSYDGILRIFNHSRQLISSTRLHTAPITSLSCYLPSSTPKTTTTDDNQTYTLATASHDLTCLLTRLTISQNAHLEDVDEDSAMDGSLEGGSSGGLATTTKSRVTPLAALHLHIAPLSSVASNDDGTKLITAAWDGLVGVWDTRVPEEHEVGDVRGNIRNRVGDGQRSRKRRKVVEEEEEEEEEEGEGEGVLVGVKGVKRKVPEVVMKSHTGRVSRAVFGSSISGGRGERGKAYSCGFDSTVRVWDVENGLCVHTITASEKPFTALALPTEVTALALSTDRTMMLYDLRVSTTSAVVPAAAFPHAALPSCNTTGTGGNQVITGAYDGIVRVWDLRSVKSALASFDAFGSMEKKGTRPVGKKVLGVDWNAERGVVGIGGEGGFVVWSFKEGFGAN
ncbi:hypothetical protein AMATHDRAFT_81797 [Amanita thiersii Skay4041]|uniref:Ribosome biogenesis protein YTM1 n=1 Tax=Amanita thiersii Skay4041 TaxID=703135 RepID=A0A2A9NCR7_9AGAR|nr:hypothetical protein AMATHDRAFT_81797 [Amanita thiersii Skay4041]